MNRRPLYTLAATALGATLAAGCPQRTQPTSPTMEPNPRPAIQASAGARIDQLRQQTDAFADQARHLPGDDEPAHRKLMADTFASLAEILPVLEGPEPDGAFRQQMQLIGTTTTQLRSLSPDLSSEPTIATGLRSAYNALVSIDNRQFSDRPEVLLALGPVQAKLDELDVSHGPLHRQAVAEAVRSIADVMKKMTAALGQRYGQATTGTTGSTTKP